MDQYYSRTHLRGQIANAVGRGGRRYNEWTGMRRRGGSQ